VGPTAAALLVLVLFGAAGCGPTALSAPDASLTSDTPDASTAPDGNAATAASGVWTNRTRGTFASGQWWTAVASDASGQRLVAASTTAIPAPGALVGGFWTSTDGGMTWTSRGGPDLGAVASNSTGTVIIGARGCWGDSELSELTNSGATWTSMMPASLGGAMSVASDATGTHLVAGGAGEANGTTNGDIWTSSNSGASWTDQTPSSVPAHDQSWISMASNSTGTQLVAVSGGGCIGGTPGGDIWTSTDSGVTWIDRTRTLIGPVHGGVFTAVASDTSGMNLVAVGSDIWTSADAGLTWIRQMAPPSLSSSDAWVSVASDATGKRLIAATFGGQPGLTGNIFTSADGGVNWTNETAGTAAAGQNWSGVASDASGVHLVAVTVGAVGPFYGVSGQLGDIWTN
jgi:hypothetical protein